MSTSNVLGGSRLYAAYKRLRRAAQNARLPQLVTRMASIGSVALAHSRLGRIGAALGRWIRGSWLYRWLTSEPDPDVVVIDLRETWTVSPVLAVLEWVFEPLARFSSRSGVLTVASRAADTFRAGPVRMLGVLVTVAVTVALVLSSVLGDPGSGSMGLQLCLLAIGLLATRIDASWQQLRDGPLGQALKAVFEPPDTPERQ